MRGRARSRRTAVAAALAALAALAVAGCGPGAGAEGAAGDGAGPQLLVTRDFGTVPLRQLERPRGGAGDTVMRLLQRNAKVDTRDGGTFVQGIDGVRGGRRDGRPVDWFYFRNGVLAEEGAAAVAVEGRDRIWWDHHDWGAVMHVPAVVGAFPEPMRSGYEGERLPTRLECIEPEARACDVAADRLGQAGVLAARGRVRGSLSAETIRILVGPYAKLRADEAVGQLERGVRFSGVYARLTPDGRELQVLDVRGKVARTLGAGTGLVAATRFEGGKPLWIITGTDAAGVEAAAAALEEGVLDAKFALAIADGVAVALPEVPRGR
jgi:hypothetical protein